MERIGLMGGTFNPIHNGHVNIARQALAQGLVDHVLFLPSGNPPHKHTEIADKLDRLAMTELAVEGETGMTVSREEIERTGVIYTVDTLRALHEQFPQDGLFFMIGADTVFQLSTWRNIETVIKLCAFLVMPRPGEDLKAVADKIREWEARGAKLTLIDGVQNEISSTEIRKMLAENKAIDALVPPSVNEYIHHFGLYGTNDIADEANMNRDKMIYRLKKDLDNARFAHTLGVEQTSREMALIFGENVEKAALAGLLHDCAKCMPLSQMIKLAKKEPIDTVMRDSKALMHALAGMCMARDVYGISDPDVLGAIRWHTTGHGNMTKLEKIVYLADVIEPNRKPWPGLEALRAACRRDLDEAMHLALRQSLVHVQTQDKPLHPDTLAALRMYEDVKE